jgi:hypothetical protein
MEQSGLRVLKGMKDKCKSSNVLHATSHHQKQQKTSKKHLLKRTSKSFKSLKKLVKIQKDL